MNAEKNQEQHKGKIVRILSKDIEGEKTVYSGLTNIKGISWGLSNAICTLLKIDKKKKIGSLTKQEIEKIKNIIENPDIPLFLFNRKKDFETGENKILTGSDLEFRKEFDIKKLKNIKSYKGLRHSSNLPVRGQRTRSHFRRNRKKGVGIKKKGKKNEKKT